MIPLLMLALAGLAMFVVSVYSEHATAKHGDDADAVRQCLRDYDPLQVWVKMTDGRMFQVCQLQDGRFGIQICDGTHECTSFIFRASKGLRVKLSQVEQYLRNIGAERIYHP
jgi:hypothetical protein